MQCHNNGTSGELCTKIYLSIQFFHDLVKFPKETFRPGFVPCLAVISCKGHDITSCFCCCSLSLLHSVLTDTLLIPTGGLRRHDVQLHALGKYLRPVWQENSKATSACQAHTLGSPGSRGRQLVEPALLSHQGALLSTTRCSSSHAFLTGSCMPTWLLLERIWKAEGWKSVIHWFTP